MQSGFLLNIVIRQGEVVFQFFFCVEQSLFIKGNTFLILDFGFNVFDGITLLGIQGKSFKKSFFGAGFNKDYHTTYQPQHQMQSLFIINVIVNQGF